VIADLFWFDGTAGARPILFVRRIFNIVFFGCSELQSVHNPGLAPSYIGIELEYRKDEVAAHLPFLYHASLQVLLMSA